MPQDTTIGPGSSVADIQSDKLTDNLGDADTLADMQNADPDRQDDGPIEDEQQLVSDSDAIDEGSNDSDLGAEQAGLPDAEGKDRATGLGMRD